MFDTPPEKPVEPTQPFKKRWRRSDSGTTGSQDGSIEKHIDSKIKMGNVLNESPRMRVVKPNVLEEEKREEGKKPEEVEDEGRDENSGGVTSKVKMFEHMSQRHNGG